MNTEISVFIRHYSHIEDYLVDEQTSMIQMRWKVIGPFVFLWSVVALGRIQGPGARGHGFDTFIQGCNFLHKTPKAPHGTG